jgi:hypothetical protein
MRASEAENGRSSVGKRVHGGQAQAVTRGLVMLRHILLPILIATAPLTVLAAEQTFGVGDVVYRKELKEALPNAFGGKDIWGRKRTVGLIEVRYLGFADGIAHFARRDTRILTNETTVNRSGAVFGSVGGKAVVLSGVGAGPTIQALAPDEFALKVEVASDPVFIIDGALLKVTQAGPNRVSVELADQAGS